MVRWAQRPAALRSAGPESGDIVSTLDDLKVELKVVLGHTRMPVHMLLRMGRGAVIVLAGIFLARRGSR